MILLDNTALSAFAHIDRLDIPSKLFGEVFIPESIGTLGILKLAHKKSLIDKDELRRSVEMLREILFFTDDLEKWALSNDK